MSRNTQAQIGDALKRLMERKSPDRITVQELADEANVNKKTFYYHYHSIPDLLIRMYSAEFYCLLDNEGVTAANWTVYIRKFAASIRGGGKILSSIISSSYMPEFMNAMQKLIDHGVEMYVRSSLADWEKRYACSLPLTDKELAYLISYHSQALAGMYVRWFNLGMQESDEEFADWILLLANNSLFSSFRLLYTKRTGLRSGLL